MIKLSWDFKGQEIDKLEMGDCLRYTMDSHDINIARTKTDDEIIVSLTMGSAYVGTYILDCFWSFELDEVEKSKKLYNDITSTIKPILKRFTKERIPTSLLSPFIRKAVSELNNSDSVKTNIPAINYSYDIPLSDDWRQTLYGGRYPKYKEESFKQYLNNSYYLNNNKIKGKYSM